MTPDSDYARLRKLQRDDYAAVRAELAAFKAEMEKRSHGLTEQQIILLKVILKWAEWIAEGFKPVKAVLGILVFLAVTYTSAKTLWEGLLK